jgi:hypothetical protein
MATASFAVGSVSVAIVWGTFFYPPPAQHALSASAVVSQTQRAAPVIATPQEAPKVAPLPKQHPSLALNGQSLAISKP